MNNIGKKSGKLEKNLETGPDLDFDKAVFLGSKSCSLDIKQNSFYCTHKGVQKHNKYALGVLEKGLENKENKHGLDYSFRIVNVKFRW